MKKEKVVCRATLIQAGHEVLRKKGFRNRSENSARLRWAAAGVAAGMLGVSAFFVSYNVLALKAAPVQQLTLPVKAEVQAALSGTSRPVWWPAGLELERSRDAAYKGLLKKKGLSYESSSPLTVNTFCSDMELFNFHCIDRQETARDLRTLPVPSVVRLSDTLGGGLFVTLQAVRGEQALLRIGDAEKEVDISDIRSHWTGQYTTLDRIGPQDASQRNVSGLGTGRRKG